MFHVSKVKYSNYLPLKTEIYFFKDIIKMLPYWVVMFSQRSSLFRFLLTGESESHGEVARTHGARAKRRTGERRWGGKEKPYIIPDACSSTNGRQLGIMIGQSRVKSKRSMSTACQQIQRNDHDNSRAQIRSIMAVVEDNSFGSALQETVKGFSQTKKMFWRFFYQLFSAKVPYSSSSFVSKTIRLKTRPVFQLSVFFET